MTPFSDRQHDAFANLAKAACLAGNHRVPREVACLVRSRTSKMWSDTEAVLIRGRKGRTMPITTDRITKTPGVCGGDACIRGTRITVWGLVEWRQMGKSEDWILSGIQNLTREDLHAAWEYADAHSGEIDEAIRLNAEACVAWPYSTPTKISTTRSWSAYDDGATTC